MTRKLLLALVLSSSCPGAVSILIEPGETAGKTRMTITQTAPNPTVALSSVTGGYVAGLEVPRSMFGLEGSESSSEVIGFFSTSPASVRETVSGQTFSLTEIHIEAAEGGRSWFGFDRIYFTPAGGGNLRFEIDSPGPVDLEAELAAFRYGVHTVSDPLFGVVTVTVVPEPSPALTMAAAVAGCLWRRRRRVSPSA